MIVNKFQAGEFTRYSITTCLTQVFLLVCMIFASVITARFLGPEGRGQVAVALLVPSLAATIGKLGIGHSINYYSNKVNIDKLFYNSIIYGLMICCVLIFLTSVIVFFFGDFILKGIDDYLIVFVIFSVPFYLFSNITNGLIQGLYYIYLCNFFSLLQALLNVLLLLLLVVYLATGVPGGVFAYTAAISTTVIVSLIYLYRKTEFKNEVLDWRLILNLMKYGTKSHIGNILKDLSYRGDILLISYFLPPESVGHYVVAVTVAEVIWKFPDAIGMVLLPKVSSMTTENAKAFTPKATRLIVIPVIFICLITYFISKPIIIGLFGIEFEPSVKALVFLIPGIFSLSLWKILANDLIAQGHANLYSVTAGVSMLAMIATDIVLIPLLGIIGASIGSSVAYISSTILIVILYSNITGNSFKSLIFPEKNDFNFYFEATRQLYSLIKQKIFFKRSK